MPETGDVKLLWRRWVHDMDEGIQLLGDELARKSVSEVYAGFSRFVVDEYVRPHFEGGDEHLRAFAAGSVEAIRAIGGMPFIFSDLLLDTARERSAAPLGRFLKGMVVDMPLQTIEAAAAFVRGEVGPDVWQASTVFAEIGLSAYLLGKTAKGLSGIKPGPPLKLEVPDWLRLPPPPAVAVATTASLVPLAIRGGFEAVIPTLNGVGGFGGTMMMMGAARGPHRGAAGGDSRSRKTPPAREGDRNPAIEPRSYEIMDPDGEPYIVVKGSRVVLQPCDENDVLFAIPEDRRIIYLRKNGERVVGTKESPEIVGGEALIGGEAFDRQTYYTGGRSVVVSRGRDRAFVYDRDGRLVDTSAKPVFVEFDRRSELYRASYVGVSDEATPGGMMVIGEKAYEVRRLQNGYFETEARTPIVFDGEGHPYYSGLTLERSSLKLKGFAVDLTSRLVARTGGREVHRSGDRVLAGRFMRRGGKRFFAMSDMKGRWKEGVVRNERGDPLVIVARTPKGRRGYVVFPELTDGDIVYGLDTEYGLRPMRHEGWRMFRKERDSFVPLGRGEIEARFAQRIGNTSVDSASLALPRSVALEKSQLLTGLSRRDCYTLDLVSQAGERRVISVSVGGDTVQGTAGDPGKKYIPDLDDIRAVIARVPFRVLKKVDQILLSDRRDTRWRGSWNRDERSITLYPQREPWTRESLADVWSHEIGHALSSGSATLEGRLIEASLLDGGGMEKLMRDVWGLDRYHGTSMAERMAELMTLYFNTVRERGPEIAMVHRVLGLERTRSFESPEEARFALRNEAPHTLRLIEHLLPR